jgi:tripartite ATP-independent transporter DctM subunit
MAEALLFGVFALALALGVPVALALLAGCVACALALGLPLIAVFLKMGSDVSSAALLAIPLFIFTGELMLRGGLSDRMIALASALVGHVRGGLGQVTVVSSALFGGVSGSAIADVSAVGGTMIPQMQKRGYGSDFAVNVTISAALVALLVPPSHNMILYSAAAGGRISITDLFAAGLLPAVLLALALMITAYVIARRRGFAALPFPGWRTVARTGIVAIPGLMLVAIIFVGIRAGIFTAVESASIAVVYGTLVTALVYRQLTPAAFVEAATGAARTAARVLFVIGAAGAFGWLMAFMEIPATMVELLQSLTAEPVVVLLLIILILLLLGTFMDMAPLIIIGTPIFLPVVRAYGVDPVHFGVILLLACGIGLITPPVGSVLFVGTGIARVPVETAMKSIWPFYVACFLVLMLVTFVPALSLALPARL